MSTTKLFLNTHGDMILTHQILIGDDHDGTIPAFIAIGLFLLLEEPEPDTTPCSNKKSNYKSLVVISLESQCINCPSFPIQEV
jgi:hypothetical protein